MWNEIKQILKKNHGTCIIVEEGQPAYVVVPFDIYQQSLESEAEPVSQTSLRFKENKSETELAEKINQEAAVPVQTFRHWSKW